MLWSSSPTTQRFWWSPDELAQKAVLDGVRVLELVDEHVVEAPADRVALGGLLEEARHEQDEVVEVDRVGRPQALLVGPEDAERDVVHVRVRCGFVGAAALLLVLVDVRRARRAAGSAARRGRGP